MAVVVDKAIWPYKGNLWAHLASDDNLSELHDFAEILGLRLMSFQGDHYDVPKEVRDQAIILGAIEIDGRELLSRLKKAKLRLPVSERPGKWEKILFFPQIIPMGKNKITTIRSNVFQLIKQKRKIITISD